jgi:hypothetical protein
MKTKNGEWDFERIIILGRNKNIPKAISQIPIGWEYYI